jgi:spore germination protein KA
MSRLEAVDVDGLEASGYIEGYIVDAPRSPLPQVLHTERPDRFASQLLNGRVGLLVDGLSFGFLVPASLPEFMRVSQDRTNNYLVAGALSVLRWLALFLSLTLPAFYTAVAMYHQEMIPTKLLLSVVQAKQDVPFSVAVEVVSMLVSFGLLQEADLRLPDPVGDTVSIIGALIVGQSAVSAKIVSPIAVIIVALAGICTYTLPSQDVASAVRLGRLGLVLCSVAAGLFGLAAGLCLMVWYLCGIESYGVNYLSPVSSGQAGGLFRALLRVPIADDKLRDPDLRTPDRRRQK